MTLKIGYMVLVYWYKAFKTVFDYVASSTLRNIYTRYKESVSYYAANTVAQLDVPNKKGGLGYIANTLTTANTTVVGTTT